MNILIFENKRNFIFTITWLGALIALITLYIMIFPVFTNDISAFETIMANYPIEILEAFGLNDIKQMASFYGFYGLVSIFIAVIVAIYSFQLALKIVGNEKINKVSDFFFTKPISRTKAFITKVIVSHLLILVVNLILLVFSYLLASEVVDEKLLFIDFVKIQFSILLLSLFFNSLGILVATVMKKIKSPATISTAIVSTFFIFNFLEPIIDDKWFEYLTIFKYFDINIIINSGFDLINVAIILVLSFIFTFGSLLIYRKQDIHTV